MTALAITRTPAAMPCVAPAATEHRELFLAAYALLANIDSRAARERLCNAVAELDELYGIESPDDLAALEAAC